jgi:serine/threonine protein kinase
MIVDGVPSQSGLRYRRILELGQGGMASVHLAVGRGPGGFNKLVVLKTMRSHLVADAEMRQLFLAEARLSARLNHPNVVQVYEVLDSTLPCIVMEFLEGQSLAAIQRAGGLQFRSAMQLRVICDALAGLHYSHELRDYDGTPLNIVHRDVSPQNIFVTYEGLVKVLDFGIAKMANAPGQTRTGIIKGKLSYMPREQMLCGALDRRADIYAVGCILWQAATGVKLWDGMREGDIMRHLLDGSIPPPSSQGPVNPRLQEIVMQALQPDPDQRFQTALELRGALDDYLAEEEPSCTMREVASFFAELFAAERSALTKSIHTSLSAHSSAPPAASTASSAWSSAKRKNRTTNSAWSSANRAPHTTSFPKTHRTWYSTHRSLVHVWSAALVIAVVAVGYVAARDRGATSGTTASTTSAQVPALIQLYVSVVPRSATVTVDGKPLVTNPGVLSVPVDALEHQIRATADNHVTMVKSIRFDRDIALELALEEIPPPATTASAPTAASSPRNQSRPPVRHVRRTRSRPAPRAVEPDRSPKATNCDPPFYLDREGIKVYRPECL